MGIIEKNSLFTLVAIQNVLIGLLNFITFKKFDILNEKHTELIATFHDLSKNRKNL